MSDHTSVLVPLGTGSHASPALYDRGIPVDTGLFAESLIYYDTVIVTVDNSDQFAAFVSRLIQQGLLYEQLIRLVEKGELRFLKTVTTHPLCVRDFFTDEPRSDFIRNFFSIQEQPILEPSYFETSVLDTDTLRGAFSDLSGFKKSLYERFCRSASKASTVLSGQDIGKGLSSNAYDDVLNETQCKGIVRELLAEIYRAQGLGEVPDFDLRIREIDGRNLREIAYNENSTIIRREPDGQPPVLYEVKIDLPTTGLDDEQKYKRLFHTLPISVAGVSNLILRSGAELKSDFFLPDPLSQIVGDKLSQIASVDRPNRRQAIVERLETTVNFPEVKKLVNTGQIEFSTVINLRKRSKRFRSWLQSTRHGEAQWEVFQAYHNEVALESGFVRSTRHALKIFGALTGAAAGASAGYAVSKMTEDPSTGITAATAATAAAVVSKLVEEIPNKILDYGAEYGRSWTPRCFGDWMDKRIAKDLTD